MIFREGRMSIIGRLLTLHKIAKQINKVGKGEVCQAKNLKLEFP